MNSGASALSSSICYQPKCFYILWPYYICLLQLGLIKVGQVVHQCKGWWADSWLLRIVQLSLGNILKSKALNLPQAQMAERRNVMGSFPSLESTLITHCNAKNIYCSSLCQVGLWGIVQYLSQDKLLMEVSGSYSPLFYTKSREGGTYFSWFCDGGVMGLLSLKSLGDSRRYHS